MYILKKIKSEYYLYDKYSQCVATTGKQSFREKKLDKIIVEEITKGIEPETHYWLNGQLQKSCWGIRIEYSQVDANKNRPGAEPHIITVPKVVDGFIIIKKVIKFQQTTPEQIASYKDNKRIDSYDRDNRRY
jgi:hypothetical protein